MWNVFRLFKVVNIIEIAFWERSHIICQPAFLVDDVPFPQVGYVFLVLEGYMTWVYHRVSTDDAFAKNRFGSMKMIRLLGSGISGIIKAMQLCAISVAHNLTHRMYGMFTYI